MRGFEDLLGGREALVAALALAQLDQKGQHFLTLLTDPLRERDSLVTIAHDAGMSAGQVMELFRSAHFAKAHALAMTRVADRLVGVVEDVAGKAVDAVVMCPLCRGEAGDSDRPCKRCNGTGEVLRESDIDRQKLIFEVAGMVKKGGGVSVNVRQTQQVATPSAIFTRVMKGSDDVAYAVEGEVVKESRRSDPEEDY